MLVIFQHAFVGFRRFYNVLNCILSKIIILTIMDFKISDTNRRKKSLLYNGYSYRIEKKYK